MGELLKNAWEGWQDFMGAGKMSALLILGILLCFFLGLGAGKQREALRYAGVTAAICICPFTAVLLMLYQTRFYDYEWIWTLVPLTAMIACCEVLFLEWFWKKGYGKEGKILYLVAAILVLNFFSSRLGNEKWQAEDLGAGREAIREVVSEMTRDQGEIILWAPREVMEQVRSIDGSVKLLYGRNLWQEHLNAYAYDTYPPEMKELYVWMEMAGRYGTVLAPVDLDHVSEKDGFGVGAKLDGMACMEKALALGADHVLLPGSMAEDEVKKLSEAFSLRLEKLGSYYLLTMVQS